MIDIERMRDETPGCRDFIHFNNAGAALQPLAVLDTVLGHLKRETEVGGYEAADEAADRLDAFYDSVARLLNGAPDEVAFIENATRAWDMAFYSLRLGKGDRVLTAMAEYASNYIAFLHVAQRAGADIAVVPNDADGQLSVEALESMIDERVKLIAVTHVPTNGGLVNPAAAIGRVAKRHGIPFLLDACQSVGQLPVDVEAIGCDMLSATGRKYLRGPRGTGFLWVRRALIERLDPPFLDLHAASWIGPEEYEMRADARRFENWECFVGGKLGLASAVDYALSVGIEAIAARVGKLAETLRNGLAAIPGVVVHDLGRERCGIVTFACDRITPGELQRRFAAERINVTTSSVFSTRHDMASRKLALLVRASVHYYNDDDEILRFCEILRRWLTA